MAGRPISTDPENCIKEEDLKCTKLIRRFELNEKEKQRRRLKKYQEENKRKRQGKSVKRKQVMGQNKAGEISCNPLFVAKFHLT
ncbi:hypothetical protein KIN20_005074 [Parelaphostrongylus tenuis]|uniref:Uncharacterized protein n=1 Tax=Parelaphostrongylus tenuis TaxID=148309 RepID=A0AAD5QH74_PARTN|nr:hypothetical protein KIN20_005074 [Parelaphostrongylus tenuis]